MKALQRLVVAGHWAAFLEMALCIGTVFYQLFTGANFSGGAVIDIILFTYGPLAAFVFVLWIFTGKFILWPWNRSLPKQED